MASSGRLGATMTSGKDAGNGRDVRREAGGLHQQRVVAGACGDRGAERFEGDGDFPGAARGGAFGQGGASNWLRPLVAGVSDGNPARTAACRWTSGTRWSGISASIRPLGRVWTWRSSRRRRIFRHERGPGPRADLTPSG